MSDFGTEDTQIYIRSNNVTHGLWSIFRDIQIAQKLKSFVMKDITPSTLHDQ